MDRHIPLMSAKVYSIALLCSLKSLNNFSSLIDDIDEETMTSKIEDEPR